MVLELEEMIRQEPDIHKREILRKLLPLNQKASVHMEQKRKSFAQKYREMFSKKFWKEARLLLRDYYLEKGKSICNSCKKEINGSFTIHHDFYPQKSYDIFTPLYVKIVHSNRVCHPPGVPKRTP